MSDEVAKLAEKLGEVEIASPWQGGICGPTEYVKLRKVLVCTGDNDISQLEALARVALEFCEEREGSTFYGKCKYKCDCGHETVWENTKDGFAVYCRKCKQGAFTEMKLVRRKEQP